MGNNHLVPKSPREVVVQMRELPLFSTDEALLLALQTHLQLFEAEGNTEAAKLMREAIAELQTLPPRQKVGS